LQVLAAHSLTQLRRRRKIPLNFYLIFFSKFFIKNPNTYKCPTKATSKKERERDRQTDRQTNKQKQKEPLTVRG
jgi:hypothetical protein